MFLGYDKTDTITRKYKKIKEKPKEQRKEKKKIKKRRKKKKRNGVITNGGWEKSKKFVERNHGGHSESENPSEFREEADHRNVAKNIS